MSDKLSRLLHVLRREETHLNSEKDNSQDEQFSGTILRDNPEIKIGTGIIRNNITYHNNKNNK